MTTENAVLETPTVQPQEVPPESSGAIGEIPAQITEVTDPAELRKQAVASIDDDTLQAVMDYLDPERRERLLGPEIERSAQSRAGKSESDAELKLANLEVQGKYFEDLTALKGQVKDGEDNSGLLEKASDLGAILTEQLYDRYLENALRRHPVHRALTPEDERKLASLRGSGTDRLTRIRNTIDVYLNRAAEMAQAPAAVRKQVEAELGLTDKLLQVAAAFKGAAIEAPSPEAARGGSDQDRLDRLASGHATADDKKWYAQRYGKYTQ